MITHSVTVRVADVQTQWEQALREGATVVMESTEFPFGERQFTVQDPGGISGLSRKRSPTSRPKSGAGRLLRPRSASLTVRDGSQQGAARCRSHDRPIMAAMDVHSAPVKDPHMGRVRQRPVAPECCHGLPYLAARHWPGSLTECA